jgi:hypothetical protein
MATWMDVNSTKEDSGWFYGKDVLKENDGYGMLGISKSERTNAREIFKDWEYDRLFPLKPYDAAEQKQNVYLDDVLHGLRENSPKYYNLIHNQITDLVGITADQVVCLVMYHNLLWCSGYYMSLWSMRMLIYDKKLCKSISDLVKILGVGINPYLGRWAEMDSLLGRGSVPADARKEMRELAEGGIKGHDIRFSKGIIKDEVTKILEKCMPGTAALPLEERWDKIMMKRTEYWDKRTEHCVNGAHHMPTGMRDPVEGGRKTRMVYLETVTESPLFKTEPMISATLSWKNENPKVRAIKSEDTIAYLNEDYIMKGVEKHWESKQVLLNPGLESREDECERVANMNGEVYVMLDYSSMDKQHSLRSQGELMEALMEFLGAPVRS